MEGRPSQRLLSCGRDFMQMRCHGSSQHAGKTISCLAIRHRFVTVAPVSQLCSLCLTQIASTSPNYVVLNKPTVIGIAANVALHKTAYQSSNYGGAVASRSVDGDLDTHSATRMASTTPWWAVDLGCIMDVGKVTVVNSWNRHYGEWRHCFRLCL